MKTFLVFALLMALVVPADAGGRRRTAATSSSMREEVTLSFVGLAATGNDAVADLGTMSQSRTRRGHGANARTVTRKPFGIRINAPGSTGMAMLRAYLESYDGRCVVRIDGIALSTMPVVINAQSPVGEVTNHLLEIEVPGSAPEGAFASAVRWEVTTQ
jgi:hypothetical protein